MRRIIPLALIVLAVIGTVAGFEVTRNTSQIIPPSPLNHGCGSEWVTGKMMGDATTYVSYSVWNHQQNFTVLTHYFGIDRAGNTWNDSMSVRIDGNQTVNVDIPKVWGNPVASMMVVSSCGNPFN